MGFGPFAGNGIAVHATLVRIGTEGVLLSGDAGVGKSTTALELMAAGGRLVADDVVLIWRVADELYGTAPRLLEGVIAIPELGIFDAREVIGPNCFTAFSVITQCVQISWPDAAHDGAVDFELYGVILPRTYRKVERSKKTEQFLRGFDLASIKQSETRFFHRHNRMVASATAC